MTLKPAVKNAVECSLIALLAAGVCLWFIISAADLDHVPAARVPFLAIGLAGALTTHLIFMAVAVKRSGRSLFGWMCAIVLLWPIGVVAFIAVLATEDKPAEV